MLAPWQPWWHNRFTESHFPFYIRLSLIKHLTLTSPVWVKSITLSLMSKQQQSICDPNKRPCLTLLSVMGGGDTCWEGGREGSSSPLANTQHILEPVHADYKAQLFWEALTSRPPSSPSQTEADLTFLAQCIVSQRGTCNQVVKLSAGVYSWYGDSLTLWINRHARMNAVLKQEHLYPQWEHYSELVFLKNTRFLLLGFSTIPTSRFGCLSDPCYKEIRAGHWSLKCSYSKINPTNDPLHSVWLWSNEQSSVGEAAAFFGCW